MRTTVIIRDVLVEESARLKRELLTWGTTQGYEAEARDPALEPDWEKIEMDGLP